MKHLALFAAAFLLSAPMASAQSIKGMSVANDLGWILGSEKACGLSYDQNAIEAWIDKNTDASDMSFASMLSTMTMGAEFELEEMSDSAKTAHCRAVKNNAKHFGFIE